MDFIMSEFPIDGNENTFNVLDPMNDGSVIAYFPLKTDSRDMLSENTGKGVNAKYGTVDGVQCLQLDGTGYVHTTERVPVPKEYTISLRVRKNDVKDGWIFANRSSSNELKTEFQMGFYHKEKTLFFNIKTAKGWFTVHSKSITYDGSAGEWFYVTVVVAKNKIKMYVNGKLEGTSNYSGKRDNKSDFTGFGCLWDKSMLFNGCMADLHFINRGYTTPEVQTLYEGMSI